MIAAVIFDLDGTVLDNEGIWKQAFTQVVVSEQLDIKANANGWVHEPGIGVTNNWVKLVGAGDLADKLAKKTWDAYWQIVGYPESIPVRDGVVELVEAVKGWGWQTALATGSEWHAVEQELEQLNLYLAFDVTTTGEEVFAPKPDPEIFLLTVQKLGIDPSECVVIEDSLAGVEAAATAGCQVIGLISDYASAQALKQAGANLTVASLAEVVVGLQAHGNQESEIKPPLN